jgi:hypothetical protein
MLLTVIVWGDTPTLSRRETPKVPAQNGIVSRCTDGGSVGLNPCPKDLYSALHCGETAKSPASPPKPGKNSDFRAILADSGPGVTRSTRPQATATPPCWLEFAPMLALEGAGRGGLRCHVWLCPSTPETGHSNREACIQFAAACNPKVVSHVAPRRSGVADACMAARNLHFLVSLSNLRTEPARSQVPLCRRQRRRCT